MMKEKYSLEEFPDMILRLKKMIEPFEKLNELKNYELVSSQEEYEKRKEIIQNVEFFSEDDSETEEEISKRLKYDDEDYKNLKKEIKFFDVDKENQVKNEFFFDFSKKEESIFLINVKKNLVKEKFEALKNKFNDVKEGNIKIYSCIICKRKFTKASAFGGHISQHMKQNKLK